MREHVFDTTAEPGHQWPAVVVVGPGVGRQARVS
jgi:hypothetical protein